MRIQGLACPLPAIPITGQASSDVIEAAQQAGVVCVISNPCAIPRALSLAGFIKDQRFAR